jgi:hypothetical protein
MAFRGLWLLSIWSFLWSLSEQAAFQFVVPPAQSSDVPNPVYQVGSVLNVQWVSSETHYLAIRMVQVFSDPNIDNYVYVFGECINVMRYSLAITPFQLTSETRKCLRPVILSVADYTGNHEPDCLPPILPRSLHPGTNVAVRVVS